MKVIVIGDIHGDYPKLDNILNKTNADLYLQVGDLAGSKNFEEWYYEPKSKPLLFIAGNHEAWDILEPYNDTPLNQIIEIEQNLWYLPLGHYYDYKGLRIGGLGGNHAPSRYNYTRDRLGGDRRRHYTIHDVEKLKKAEHLDILLTHEAPHPFFRNPFIPGSENMGKKEITNLVHLLKPRYHFFGHHHVSRKQMIDDTVCACVPIFNYVEVEINV